MTPRARAAELIQLLPKVYPGAHTELNFSNALELLIATILSAQCTDKRVNMVTPALFKKYRTAAAYAKASPAELEKAIQSTGFFRNKARSIRGATAVIAQKYGGKVPETMEELRDLPGVGRKTANVVLGNAFGKNEGVVVDTHVTRVSQRLRLTRNTDETDFSKTLDRLESLADLARTSSMFRSQTRLLAVRDLSALPERQNISSYWRSAKTGSESSLTG
jgi:endonuclease-3